ncbi:MAG: DNA repair protein RadC [Bacteroidales bacterium]|nr:DNA repair protein RadC [Bacteroidales bacterium]
MANNDEPISTSNIPISQWAEEDRPREKMLANGKKALTDSELIAILLRTGVKGTTAIELAQNLLKHNNNSLSDLARMEVPEMMRNFKGLGMAKAVTVLAALELGNRMVFENLKKKEEIVKSSQDFFDCIAAQIIDLPHEEFWAIFLNQRNKVTWKQCIGMGGLTQTTVDPRILFKAAIEHNAVAIAVAHNHPSGNLTPSQADKTLTQHLSEGGKLLHIKIIDHLIVGILPSGKRDYFSFSENGLL